MKKGILYTIYAVVLIALLYFDKVINYFMSAINVVTDPIKCRGILLCAIGAVLIITIECLRKCYPNRQPKAKGQDLLPTPLYSDQPTTIDKYGRTTSAELLVKKIFTTYHQQEANSGSFVININEAYGFGKTSFLKIFGQQLVSYGQPHILIEFRPWLCDSEQSIIHEFFTLLTNQLPNEELKDNLSDYLNLLLQQAPDFAPLWAKPITKIIAHYSKTKTLQNTHDNIKGALSKLEYPIIVTIDDVDRLEQEELISVLKLIRDTADFPNIFYILAADNNHIEAMLKRMGIKQPTIFLKKFFNIDYLLPAHESVPAKFLATELRIILGKYNYPIQQINDMSLMFAQLPHINKIFNSMREVYRFLNTYTSSLDIISTHNNLNEINPYELLCLTIIKHLRIDIYKILRDRNDEFLEVKPMGLDSFFHLKDGINLEMIIRNKNLYRKIDKDGNEIADKDKTDKELEEKEKMSLNDVLKLTQITDDKMVFFMLDHLFGKSDHKDECSIRRCNTYFIYFSGNKESTKQSTAETIEILKMDQKSYETKINMLFKEGKALAFSDNFTYAYQKVGRAKEEIMKKYYTFLKYQYINNPKRNPLISTPFEEFINRYHDKYITILGELYGKYIIERDKTDIKEIQNSLQAYCQSEDDLNMLALAFYLFSLHLSNFCFGREFIEPMIDLISNRLINEHMRGAPVLKIPYSTFSTIKLFKEEHSTRDIWQKKFEAFLCEDELRCKQWLCSMVDIFDNNNIEWNYYRHTAILGEYSNSGEEMLNRIKEKFPDCSEAIEELINLQAHPNLVYLSLKDSKYIQMARKIWEDYYT